jgi:hypothetical protein
MKKAVVITTMLVAVLAAADQINPVRAGLNASYFANTTWSGPAAVTTRDPQLSNERLRAAWHGTVPERFSATWLGWLLVMHDGQYGLATISDDDSAVFVDGQQVVDNSGRRTGPRGATGAVTLTRGVHAIYVRYVQDGGPRHLELLWAPAGRPLTRVPTWAVTPRRVGFAAFLVSAALKQWIAAAEWIWVASAVLWALTLCWSWISSGKAWLERDQVWPAMRWILLISLALNLTAIWWGLPGGDWMPDELTPAQVMDAWALRFAHGWFDRYPPLHFYVLTAVFSPILFLDWLGRLDASTGAPYALLALAGRLVSIAAGVGVLLAAYACGARAFGKRAGVFAAGIFAVVTPFVYYGKSANLDVPYLFWFAVSLVFYLRAVGRAQLNDVVGFAAFGALAICTKDQAYGLYVLPPLAIVHRLWRLNRGAGLSRPLVRAVFNARMALAAVAALSIFVLAHNVVFNASGFRDHVLLILGPASETYRDFEPTMAGRLALLRLTGEIIRVAWGWPMLLAGVVGVALALRARASRAVALFLMLPVASYYLTFVDVVLYNYDRFMLPVCLVLSLFGGLAFDRWLSAGPWRRTRVAAAAVAFTYTLICAATVDVAMVRDSRYTVEAWLRAHVTAGDVVGYVFPLQYYPRLDRFSTVQVTASPQLKRDRPEYFVLNADYAHAEPSQSEIGRMIGGLEGGTLGYTLVFRFRHPAPWPWLPGAPRDLVGNREERPVTSVLRHVNPSYEVFKRIS